VGVGPHNGGHFLVFTILVGTFGQCRLNLTRTYRLRLTETGLSKILKHWPQNFMLGYISTDIIMMWGHTSDLRATH